MRSTWTTRITWVIAGIFVAGSLAAMDINKLPPDNWKVSTGVHTEDIGGPSYFTAVAPCRIVDTRGTPGVPINTGGAFFANEVRTWTFTGLCGIPAGARSVSLNITVTNTGGQTPFGFVKVWPGGGTEPNVSTLNWSTGGVTESNAAIVPFSTTGTISLRSGNNSADVIVDTNGYFLDALTSTIPAGEYVGAIGAGAGVCGLGFFDNSSANTDPCTSAVRGFMGTNGNLGAAVLGDQNGTGANFGVRGNNNPGSTNSAGVLGVAIARPITGGFITAGVRGESTTGFGVVGFSQNLGVGGKLNNTAGGLIAEGILGSTFGTAFDATGPPWGVFAGGNLGASGAKHFVEPDPADASRVILYSSLEGREVGTYFRGTARTVNHEAVITVPDDFRIVTDEEGLTVQVTPVGASANVYVSSEDLNTIVIRSSREVTFHYLVQGVRRAFKDFQVYSKDAVFAPRGPDDVMPLYLTEEAKRRLIANGTWNADGTVNMQTAERMGWAAKWRAQQQSQKPAEPRTGDPNRPN